MWIYRNICANGSRPAPRPKAISSWRATSIRRASCEGCSSFRPCASTMCNCTSGNDGRWVNKKPAVFTTAGHFSACSKFRKPYSKHSTHTQLDGTGRAFERPMRSGDDLGNPPADAGAGQADHAGRTGGQVEHTATDERAAVVDGDDDTAITMGHPELGAERQAAVGRGHGAGVHALAGGGPAAGFVAVIGGHAREATSGRRGDRGIGVKPGTAGPADGRVAGVMM